jgi:hypothetical protein
MKTEHFERDAVLYARQQGDRRSDSEFVEEFQRHLNSLPSSNAIKKIWLEKFICESQSLYDNHIKKMNGIKCEPGCRYHLGFERGIPHAQAELLKIDKLYLAAEKIVSALKGFPKWFVSKATSFFVFK